MSELDNQDMSLPPDGSTPAANPPDLLAEDIKNLQRNRCFKTASFVIAWLVSVSFFIMTLYMVKHAIDSDIFYQKKDVSVATNVVLPERKDHQLAANKASIAPELSASKTENKAPSKESSEKVESFERVDVSAMTHYLLMLTIVSAIGMTMAMAVMRFGQYSKNSKDIDEKKDELTLPFTSPTIEAVKNITESALKTISNLTSKDK